jgi:hypothetical protein
MKRRFLAVTLVVAAVTLPANTALGHQGNPSFRSEVRDVHPSLDGLDVQVLNYDDSLQLINRSGDTVTVLGYQDEPYLRIRGDGEVAVNTRSPSYYLNNDRYAEADVPASADSSAAPEWQTVDGSSQYTWHDHRIHYMSRGTPPQVKDTGERTKVFDYKVPIEVDGKRGSIDGTLFWVGQESGFPVMPFVGLGVVALIAIGIVAARRRRGASRDQAPSKEAW